MHGKNILYHKLCNFLFNSSSSVAYLIASAKLWLTPAAYLHKGTKKTWLRRDSLKPIWVVPHPNLWCGLLQLGHLPQYFESTIFGKYGPGQKFVTSRAIGTTKFYVVKNLAFVIFLYKN